jgi:chromosome segregation ATPase
VTRKEDSYASRVESLEIDLNAYKSLIGDYKSKEEIAQSTLRAVQKEKADLEDSIKVRVQTFYSLATASHLFPGPSSCSSSRR